jgi:hypothetical protein
MFKTTNTIKEGSFATIQKGIFEGIPAVRKSYLEGQGKRYRTEIQNLDCMRNVSFGNFVDRISEDPTTLSLVYPFINGANGYEALETQDPEVVLSRIFESIVIEGESLKYSSNLPFSFIPEGYKTENEHFFYSRLLSNQGDLTSRQRLELRKLIALNPPLIHGRYDPELSNFMVTPDDVFSIDYESMTLQDPLFAFAYSLVHLRLDHPGKIEPERFLELAKGSISGIFCSPGEFEDRMRINIAEVTGYLFLELKREILQGNGNPELEGKINKLESILNDTI